MEQIEELKEEKDELQKKLDEAQEQIEQMRGQKVDISMMALPETENKEIQTEEEFPMNQTADNSQHQYTQG